MKQYIASAFDTIPVALPRNVVVTNNGIKPNGTSSVVGPDMLDGARTQSSLTTIPERTRLTDDRPDAREVDNALKQQNVP